VAIRALPLSETAVLTASRLLPLATALAIRLGFPALLGLLVIAMACSEQPSRQRSVLLITIDTLRAEYLGAYGFDGGPVSPNIDALARRGALFERAIAASSMTAPSHATIMTSLPALRHSIGNRNGATRLGDEVTLARVLKGAGYSTAAFVGNVVLNRRIGLDSGFDVYDDELPAHERNRPLSFERVAADTTRNAIAWLRQPREGHFFLWVHYQDPHGPYDPPEDALELLPYDLNPGEPPLPVLESEMQGNGIPAYQAIDGLRLASQYRHRYAGEILYADRWVGELLAAARAADAGDDLVVLLTADHGEALGDFGFYFEHGHATTPDVSHVPFILAASDLPVQRRSELVGHIDVMPTLLELAGQRIPEASEGMALGPALKSQDAIPSRTLYCDIPRQVSAYRENSILNLRVYDPDGTQEPIFLPMGLSWSPDLGVRKDDEALDLLSEAQAYVQGAVPTIEAELLTPEEVRRLQALGYVESDDGSP
jgi:arylsulfatase A-like enzyme